MGSLLLFERDSPEDAGLPPMVEEVEVESEVLTEDIPEDGWKKNVLLNVVFMGCVYFVFTFLRYALDSWSPLAHRDFSNRCRTCWIYIHGL